jgi:hypothetical protein
MKKAIAFLPFIVLAMISCGQPCTVKDCLFPFKATCFDWCTHYALTNGNLKEITEVTGSINTAKVIINLPNRQNMTIESLRTFVTQDTFQLIKKRDSTLRARAIRNARDTTQPKGIADDIILIIEQQQKLHVKESCTTDADGCFTKIDLHNFETDSIVSHLASYLVNDEWFRETVRALTALSAGNRETILNNARMTRHRTWRELGNISCEGQTDNGKRAEEMIANGIVSLAEKLIHH